MNKFPHWSASHLISCLPVFFPFHLPAMPYPIFLLPAEPYSTTKRLPAILLLRHRQSTTATCTNDNGTHIWLYMHKHKTTNATCFSLAIIFTRCRFNFISMNTVMKYPICNTMQLMVLFLLKHERRNREIKIKSKSSCKRVYL